MAGIFQLFALIIAIAAMVPAVMLAVEVLGAFLKRVDSTGDSSESFEASAAIVVPAHNEDANITATLSDIKAQMTPGDRLIVVADNCDDDTADIARASGAECLVREDKFRRGKGYALQFALDALRADPPQLVVFADADCRIADGVLDALKGAALRSGRPVQALYLMKAPEDAPPRLRVAEFAWRMVNEVRMRGLDRLFGVTRLTGAGMAMPWSVVEDMNIASGEIVEDLALTLELVRRKAPPMLISSAIVESEFPASEEGAAKQRARWEQGSVKLAARKAGPLLIESLTKGNVRLAIMALDLLIPPLTILAALIIAALLVGVVTLTTGFVAPFWLALGAFVLFVTALIAAWFRFGRIALPTSAFSGLFQFFLSKANVYGREGRASAKTWTRTERSNEGGDPAP